jgi:hypothetical protein
MMKKEPNLITFPGDCPGIAKTGTMDADQIEKSYEQYTREQGGLPPCLFSERRK